MLAGGRLADGTIIAQVERLVNKNFQEVPVDILLDLGYCSCCHRRKDIIHDPHLLGG